MTSRGFDTFSLSRAQLLRLTALSKVDGIVGIEISKQELEQAGSSKKLDQVLVQNKFLGKTLKLTPVASCIVDPERAMIVVRDRPGEARQNLVLLWRAGRLILRTVDNSGNKFEYRTINPNQVGAILQNMLPHPQGDQSETKEFIQIQGKVLEKLVLDVTDGRRAPQVHEISTSHRKQLIDSIQNRVWSASCMVLELEKGKALDAESFMAWSDGRKVWSADLVSAEGLMRVHWNSGQFLGMTRKLTRRLTHNPNGIRTYRLSATELAFALSTVNRQDLASKFANAAETKAWNTAGDHLLEQGVMQINARGNCLLTGSMERDILPLAHPGSHEIVIKTQSSRGKSQANLYLHDGKGFCFHHVTEGQHVLECGEWSILPKYLNGLFPGIEGFAPNRPDGASITFGQLTDLLGEDLKQIKQLLKQYGMPQQISTDLSAGLEKPDFIAVFHLPDRSTLMLIKSKQQGWIGKFPSLEAKGTIHHADPNSLINALTASTPSN